MFNTERFDDDQFREELLNCSSDFENSLVDINYSRCIKFLPVMVLIAITMFVAAYFLQDQYAIIINNLMLTLVVSLLWVSSLFVDFSSLKYGKKGFTYVLMVTFLLWGTSMLGYKANSPISYFDLMIVTVVVGIFIQMSWKAWSLFYLTGYIYLIFGTPFMASLDENLLLTCFSIALFLILCVYLSHMFYNQSYENYEMNRTLMEHNKRLKASVIEKSKALLKEEQWMTKEITLLLTKVLEGYDEASFGHSERVAKMCENMGIKMGFDEARIKELYYAGLIHDIGKIHVDKEILNKPEALNPLEYDLVKKHPKFAFDMMNQSETLKNIAQIILHHHERYDGQGYPFGLEKDAISTESMIIAVTETWDVMRSRAYSEILTIEQARLELIKNSGTQFSPPVIAAFLELVIEELEDSEYPKAVNLC